MANHSETPQKHSGKDHVHPVGANNYITEKLFLSKSNRSLKLKHSDYKERSLKYQLSGLKGEGEKRMKILSLIREQNQC